MSDNIFFSDISYFQKPVNDSYPHPVLSIRSNDGTFRDPNFAANYAWMRRNLDSGKLGVGIVYCYVRTNWLDTANTMRNMINANGGLHPKVALMLDVESGGNPGGDGSDWINRCYWNLVDFCGGNAKRVFGYANKGDFFNMWRTRPAGLRVVGAGYGQNPQLPGQIAHQYTDGVFGAGQGLPMGAPPFGNCDMNTAPYTVQEFAAQLGIGQPVVNEIDAAAQKAAAWIGKRLTPGEMVCPDGVGRWAQFENGYIYWSPKTGAHPIPNGGGHGGLWQAFADSGWETGFGYPVADHAVLPGGGVQAFERGVLYKKNGAERGFYVGGKILDRFAGEGYETGSAGWPKSFEYDRDGGRAQDFDGGTFAWRADGVVKL